MQPPPPAPDAVHPNRSHALLSRITALLAIVLIVATYLLLSPPTDRTYPGAIPWAPDSVLKAVVDLLALGGVFPTHRGVEIKSVFFQLVAVFGLALLACRALAPTRAAPTGGLHLRGAWFYAQLLFLGWTTLALASAAWSGDPTLSIGQATLYFAGVAWAITLSWTLRSGDLPRVLGTLVFTATLATLLCFWYYVERNPFHRPGFPIGNPAALAATLLPATLIALAIAVGGLWSRLSRHTTTPWTTLVAAAIAALILLAGLRLTSSRAAFVGLAAGLLTLGYLQVARRHRRYVWAAGLLIAIVGGAWLYSARYDLSMARGASLRFRLYTWRYAAELWTPRPVGGVGAGSYPRLASYLAIPDQRLDPAAFMGDIVEHAHNELLEVLAEVGLFGGLLYVGALVATFYTAGALLRHNHSPPRRWLLNGLTAALVAMIVDSFFGVALRLPGAPALFYTLLGVLFAAGRVTFRDAQAADPTASGMPGGTLLQLRRFAAVTAGVLALLMLYQTARNATATLAEHEAYRAFRNQHYRDASNLAHEAAGGLLDPVRVLLARDLDLRSANALAAERLPAAQQAIRQARQQQQTRPAASAPVAPPIVEQALLFDARLHERAAEANRNAPNFGRMPTLMAHAAERMTGLLRAMHRPESGEWNERAKQAWLLQRSQQPHDVETLLALAGYTAVPAERLGLLRDALRGGVASSPEYAVWQDQLRQILPQPGFDRLLAAFLQEVAPYTADSELESLIVSMAPETYRLAAAAYAQRNNYTAAAELAQRAVRLYAPMRHRFPYLPVSAALEHGTYSLFARIDQPDTAIEILRAALENLPAIQAQKQAALAAPLRLRLAQAYLVAGEPSAGRTLLARMLESPPDSAAVNDTLAGLYRELIQRYARTAPEDRPPVERWIDQLLALRPANFTAWGWRAWLAAETRDYERLRNILSQARSAGLTENQVAELRRTVCAAYPDLPAEFCPSRDR